MRAAPSQKFQGLCETRCKIDNDFFLKTFESKANIKPLWGTRMAQC